MHVMTSHLRALIFSMAVIGCVVASNCSRGMPASERAALAARVRGEFQHAWTNYQRFAAGHDELNPVSRTPHDWYPPLVVSMTPVDALDTLLLMKFNDEADAARRLIDERLNFDADVSVQVFEVTIRLLGGLLSAHQMTGDPKLLQLADDLGGRLLPAFNSPTGMPYRYVNLRTAKTDDAVSNPAEIGTLIIEFGTLSKLTGKETYVNRARAAIRALHARRSPTTGLFGDNINVETGEWTSTASHVGGGIDSYFEYLLKCERLFGDRECGQMYREAMTAVNKYVADERPDGLWYGVVDMKTGARTATTYGSLEAFLPAVLSMSGDVARARRLQDSGFRMWTLYGIEPEAFDYAAMKATDERYQLRPEIIESAYYLYHYTKDPKYLEMGRTFLDDLVKCCRTDNGYTTLTSVVTKAKGDRQHSFFLAETLKYLYLLFAPEAIDFDSVTFNTEAHPLKRQ